MDSTTFMSFNSTGLDTAKVRFSLDLCEEYDVTFIAIQEHFKFLNVDKYFKSSFVDFSSYAVPGHRSPGQMMGRAKAGLAQLCNKKYSVKRVRVATTGFRVQAQIIGTPTSRVLWINTYLPPDPQLQRYDDSELQEVLMEVRNILQNSQYDDVVWGSDLNWDPSRNSQFSTVLSNFVQETGLVSLWDRFPVPYTHTHTDGRSRSVLDHFLLTPRLLSLVEGCGAIERGDNRSRHCPIWVRLKLGALPIRKISSKWIPKRPAWSKATPDKINLYKEYLKEKLVQYETPVSLQCQDPKCKIKNHTDLRDNFVLDILSAMIESCHATLPTYGGCQVGEKRLGVSIPGWSTEVKPYQEESIYWGNLWKQVGRPTTGYLHEAYIQARRQYHLAVLRVKRKRRHYQAEQLLVASMEGDVELIKQMKIIKKGIGDGNRELPDVVGGAEGEQNIAELFKESYEQLYNSASSEEEIGTIKDSLEKMISVASREEVEKVTGSTVKEAVSKLKLQKTDVSGSYVSDALKNAPDILYDQLALVFKSWLYHGTVSPTLLACSFMPLLKSSGKDPADLSSYRAIAGSSLILKTFELVVLVLWGHLLSSDSLQFGYKARTSTTHCTWLVSGIVQHMLKGGINPILTVLDCSKAFDKCKFSILFNRLLDKGLLPIVVRVLLFIYMEQYRWVKWGDARSTWDKTRCHPLIYILGHLC